MENLTILLPWIWLIIMVICILIESFTFSLTTIWAAISSIPMIFISKTNLPLRWQFLFFLIMTIVLIIFTRPFAIKKLKLGKYKTNVESLIGQEVLVTKTISPFNNGEVKSKNGVIWHSKSEDNSEILVDTICNVVSIEGNTLIVKNK